MSDSDDTPTTDESVDEIETTASTSSFKVLGKFSDADGCAVFGFNEATNGTPVGVKGEVGYAGGYGLLTPDDAKVEGDVETTSTHRVTINGKRALRIDGEASSGAAGNVIAGHSNNAVGTGVVGATIGGGGFDDGTTAEKNQVFDNYGTVAGGSQNTAGSSDSSATSGHYGSVIGGYKNTASGPYAAVLGGRDNEATKRDSVAGGRGADANHRGAIVFGDATTTTIASENPNEMRVQHDLYAKSTNETSARAAKRDVSPVDPESVLSGVEDLEVSTWRYDRDAEGGGDAPEHMGPMAAEFHETFGLGEDDGTIASVDRDGVALAAIQGLSARLDRKDERIEALEAENERLRDRLATVEGELGVREPSASPADD